MDYEKEAKQRFVQMLKDRQIIVIQGLHIAKSYDFKIIGANNDGKWDFTALVSQLSGCSLRSEEWKKGVKNPTHTFLRTSDCCDIIRMAVDKLIEEGYLEVFGGDNYSRYQWIREHISTFCF